jgi:hypothetical protein
VERATERIQRLYPGFGMGNAGGGQALNQLLVVMDGIDEPPVFRKFLTNRVNTFLDAMFVVPSKVGKASLRLPRARPRKEQDLLHRRLQRADQRARPGAHAPGPDGSPHLVPHGTTGSTSSISTSRTSPTSPTSTPSVAATSSHASRMITRPR